jgi:signal transduction histidine kinase
MNRDAEQSPIAEDTVEKNIESSRKRGLVARIRDWAALDSKQSERELEIRQEEQARERARIARELHDSMFQGMLAASLQLHHAVEQIPADCPNRPKLDRALELLRHSIDEGRGSLQGLRSSGIASMSLEHALYSIRDDFEHSDQTQFRIFVTGQPKALKPAVQEQLYMIGREALVNAMRHSQATEIEAEVEYLPRRVRVVVRDNGRGMDAQVVRSGRESHWGLLGMRERADSIRSQLRIWSRPGAGTEVEVSVPGEVVAGVCA